MLAFQSVLALNSFTMSDLLGKAQADHTVWRIADIVLTWTRVQLVCVGVQGVCKSLFQHGLLPRVMAGSSVGSIGRHSCFFSHCCRVPKAAQQRWSQKQHSNVGGNKGSPMPDAMLRLLLLALNWHSLNAIFPQLSLLFNCSGSHSGNKE